MTCPHCSAPVTYQGFTTVECATVGCANYRAPDASQGLLIDGGRVPLPEGTPPPADAIWGVTPDMKEWPHAPHGVYYFLANQGITFEEWNGFTDASPRPGNSFTVTYSTSTGKFTVST
jgi:hypothetical protein